MPDSTPHSELSLEALKREHSACGCLWPEIENRFWRSQVGADPDEPLAIPIHGEAPPEAIELGRKLAERYGWESNPAKEPDA